MAQDLIDKIRAAAQAKNVDPDVAVKIAQAESNFNPEAGAKTSSAKGLFQIVNKTWSGAGGKPGQQKNPDENIRVGTDIIASNTDFLRKNLGRDPRASEVYAAHFFGPTGASTLLAAAPDTPASSLFSPAVLKANPQLQGMNAEQIRGMLSKKMGETTPTPAPAKPTGQTPAEQIMEPALRSGMTASAEDLGSGYKAALALSFLGADEADKPESDDDLQARLDKDEEDTAAAEMAAYKPKNALANLKLSATSHLQQPVKLASGGLPFTPSAGIKGSAREELDAIKAQYDKYNADADAYNAALNKYKTDLYDPYIAAIAKYNTAAEEWNKGPRTTAFGMTAPTAPAEFTMTAPTAPKVSAEDYAAKQTAAKQDMTQRQLAIDAASDPERYGLTINKFFADGGPVYRAGGSPMTGEDPQQAAIDEMLSDEPRSFLSRASDAVQSAARQGLDAMFPVRRIVRAGVEPMAQQAIKQFEQAVKDDPQAYLENKNFGEDLASRAHFHIKNAGRRALGLEPFKDESRAYLGPITENSFPDPNNPIPPELRTPAGLPPFRRGRFADGGDVVSSNMPLNPNPMAGTPELMMMHGGVVHRADGSPEQGEVPTPMLFSVPTYAETVSHEMYPGQGGQFDQKDAARHMLAAGTLARKYGPEWAERLGQLHEIKTSPLSWIGSKLGISQMPVDYEQDLHNNRVGIELAKRSKSQKDLEDLINMEAERARNQQTPGAAWIGKPVRRADGSPETGEMGVGFFNPNIQRQGQKARALAAQRDVNTLPDPRTYAAVSGFLGTPPDQQGFSVLHPDLEGIKKAGEAGFAAGTAAAVAPVVGPAAKALGKLAAANINERMLSGRSLTPVFNTPPPIMFAVREPGGPLLQVPQRSGSTFVDNKTGKALEQVDPLVPIMHDLAGTPDHRLNEWFRNKVGSYIRRDMGTEKDQFVKAADEGRRLHFVEKPGQNFTMSQAAADTPHSVKFVRETEGFPPEGFAKTPYGRLVENKTDWSVWPMEAGTLLGDTDESLLLPVVRDLAKKNPQMRVHEINPQIEKHLGLTSLRDQMFKMRQMSPEFSAYNQPAVKIPERYLFTDQTLQGLTPAQASERVAQFDTWKQETRQKLASQAVLKDPALSRTPVSEGHVWINPPDLEDNPAVRRLIQDVGCDGGWCTKDDYQAISNGSGENRLSILMDNKARPKAQMTITSKDYGPDDFLASLERDELDAFKANNPDVALWQPNSIIQTPEFQQWKAMNPPTTSVTEIKGVNNSTDLRGKPYLKQIQEKIKDLDARFGLQNVDNLDGIGMTDMSSHFWSHPAIANRPPIGREGMKAVGDEAARLNGGSRFIENDKTKIDSIIQQAADNILGPEGHATGGMIERKTTDNRRYL